MLPFVLFFIYFVLSPRPPHCSTPPSVPTFPENRLSFDLLPHSSSSSISLSPVPSLDSRRSTFNVSYLLIKYLQVSTAAMERGKRGESGRQREIQRERRRVAAGVVQALAPDMKYSQIPGAEFE